MKSDAISRISRAAYDSSWSTHEERYTRRPYECKLAFKFSASKLDKKRGISMLTGWTASNQKNFIADINGVTTGHPEYLHCLELGSHHILFPDNNVSQIGISSKRFKL